MGKKKFIDKKKASTFQLIARDSSDPNYDDSPGGDRVFIQVAGPTNEDADSRFDDAPEDEDGDRYHCGSSAAEVTAAEPLPEKVRKEILELGFPDDGYNYLSHLRQIKNTGGGSNYYSNPKAQLEQLPNDVKAYDASRLRIAENESPDEKVIYSVASKTVNVRVQRVVDPEVAALLDGDSDDAASRLGSDVEDLEEDFVVKANLPDGDEEEEEEKEEEDVCVDESSSFAEVSENQSVTNGVDGVRKICVGDDPRARRDVDEEFDMVLSREYDNDDDDDDEYDGGGDDDYYGYGDEEHESIEEKLKNVKLNDCVKDDFELNEYEVPGDGVEIQKTKVLGKIYENEDQEDVTVLLVEESSDESEKWDCETVLTTYSTLENHPVKIGAPELSRKKKLLSETVFAGLNASNSLIKLGGKQKLPVDFLPHNRKPAATEKVEETVCLKTEQQRRKQHGQETKEEKKERKVAVKEERREARRAKKELKELYKGEAQHAQRIAAISAPPSKRLM